jgi:hypothetical protein
MTKTNPNNHYKPTPVKDLKEDYFSISPYFNVAREIMTVNGIENPNVPDLYDAFWEIAKVANKLDKEKKNLKWIELLKY